MCTVTFVPRGTTRRIAFNRDEQRTRAPAEPPRAVRFGDRAALMPIDPESGGTWLAVNDMGLAFLLINRNPDVSASWQHKRAEQVSRGMIVPKVARAGSMAEADALLREPDPARYALFRLLVDDGETVREWISDGDALTTRDHALDRPLLFTSSGLGDRLVEGPRRELFEQMFNAPADDWLEAQRAFHAHHWPQQRHVSVDMARADAMTVSVTAADVGPDRAAMRYRDSAGVEHAAALALRVSAA